jgi:hypothetical protein
VILLQLGLKAAEQRKRVGGGTGETREDLVVVQVTDLAGAVLNDPFAQRDLAIARHHHLAVPAHAQDGRRAH